MNTSLLLLTVVSLGIAAWAVAIAWRISRENVRRAEARLAGLAADIHGPGAVTARPSQLEEAEEDAGAAAPFPPSYSRVIAVASALVFFAIGLTLTAWRTSPNDRPRAAVVESTPAAAPALELVTLSHTATKDGLLVTGRIHNPQNAIARRDLAVVVLIFDAQGLFLGSAEEEAGGSQLEPGASATFAVTVPSRTAAARYKVSFRQGDAVVPHVDKRNRPTQTATTSAREGPAGSGGRA